MPKLLSPWQAVDHNTAATLEAQLRRELGNDHDWATKGLRALARRLDRDDVLYEVGSAGLVEAHLTWADGPPRTELFATLDEWLVKMAADHADYAGWGRKKV